MIHPEQLREMITEVLETSPRPELKSSPAIELLMLTAATESRLGTYFRQVNGPALGIFQIEPATEEDMYKHFLQYPKNADLYGWVDSLRTKGDLYDLKYNIAYQIALARIHYWRVPKGLPSENPIELAYYWKEYFNTSLGRGTVTKAVTDYENLVVKEERVQ